MAVHILGIRHHGSGSAKNVLHFLETNLPDLVLIEGPPEANELIAHASHEGLQPPVAILAYELTNPQKAVFYPFANFSPEWQAIKFCTDRNVPARFFDLPLTHSFAIDFSQNTEDEEMPVRKDPFDHFAEIAGLEHGEAWWDTQFESAKNATDVFKAVELAVSTLRNDEESVISYRDKMREAWMRKQIKQGIAEGFKNIVVVCGAWHVPAVLENALNNKEDNQILKGLPKTKVECTWIPWTYQRLSYQSGYGAGLPAPGWYHHLWQYPNDQGSIWATKIAKTLREKNIDTSVAHTIEVTRLAETLASMRLLPRPGLAEYQEAVVSVIGFGDEIILNFLQELLIGTHIGSVPDTVPKVPLLTDFEKLQKQLRLSTDATIKEMVLDLRTEIDLKRSIFFHRLKLFGIQWAHEGYTSGKGTFKEAWTLRWQPEIVIRIIELGVWGNTFDEACSNYLIDQANNVSDIVTLSKCIEQAIPADVPKAVDGLTNRLDQIAATTNDVFALMQSVPPLSQVIRYGNVRNTNTDMLKGIVTALITRACIGLPLCTVGIDEEVAEQLKSLISETNISVPLLEEEELTALWQESLQKIALDDEVHPILAGFVVRLLLDKGIFTHEQVADLFQYAVSINNESIKAAFWSEGFLNGAGTLLLIDNDLWNILHHWVSTLEEENFVQILPILRRTFSNFSSAERTKIGEKARIGTALDNKPKQLEEIDFEKFKKGLPVIFNLLNLKNHG